MKKRRKGPLKALRHALAYVLIRATFAILGRLPEPMLQALGTLLGRLLCLTPLYAAAKRNITLAYGDTPPSPKFPTADALARACLQHYAWLMMEMTLLDRWQPLLLQDHAMPDDALITTGNAIVARGHGVILATGHIANWEVFGRAIAAKGFQVRSMAKASFDERVANWLVAWRKRGGVTTLNRGSPEAIKSLRPALAAGGGLGVLVDVDTKVRSAFVPFFGTLTSTPTAAADLALKLDAPILVAWSWRERWGLFGAAGQEVPVERTGNKDEDARRITAAVTKLLEDAIRAHPEQWIWSHRRWRTRPPV